MLRNLLFHPGTFDRLMRKFPLLILCLWSIPALAGNFSVSPIRLDFDGDAKNGAITIANVENEELRVQMKLSEWSQDPSGKDVYTESEDLLFFPRIMTLGPNEQRVVRVGLRRLSEVPREKSYRLFIEEIPGLPKEKAKRGAHLALAVRFGAPLFVHPAKEQASGSIHALSLDKGVLRMRVQNTGNVHFRIETIGAKGGAGFEKEVQGWYLLPGATREYEIPVTAEACKAPGHIAVAVKTDKLQLEETLEASATMCIP